MVPPKDHERLYVWRGTRTHGRGKTRCGRGGGRGHTVVAKPDADGAADNRGARTGRRGWGEGGRARLRQAGSQRVQAAEGRTGRVWTEHNAAGRVAELRLPGRPRPATTRPACLTKTLDLAYGMCVCRCGQQRPRMAGMPAGIPRMFIDPCAGRHGRRTARHAVWGTVIRRYPAPACPPPCRASCCQGPCGAVRGCGLTHGKNPRIPPAGGWGVGMGGIRTIADALPAFGVYMPPGSKSTRIRDNPRHRKLQTLIRSFAGSVHTWQALRLRYRTPREGPSPRN